MLPTSLTAYHEVHIRKTNFCNPPTSGSEAFSGRNYFLLLLFLLKFKSTVFKLLQCFKKEFFGCILLLYTQSTATKALGQMKATLEQTLIVPLS